MVSSLPQISEFAGEILVGPLRVLLLEGLTLLVGEYQVAGHWSLGGIRVLGLLDGLWSQLGLGGLLRELFEGGGRDSKGAVVFGKFLMTTCDLFVGTGKLYIQKIQEVVSTDAA